MYDAYSTENPRDCSISHTEGMFYSCTNNMDMVEKHIYIQRNFCVVATVRVTVSSTQREKVVVVSTIGIWSRICMHGIEIAL